VQPLREGRHIVRALTRTRPRARSPRSPDYCCSWTESQFGGLRIGVLLVTVLVHLLAARKHLQAYLDIAREAELDALGGATEQDAAATMCTTVRARVCTRRPCVRCPARLTVGRAGAAACAAGRFLRLHIRALRVGGGAVPGAGLRVDRARGAHGSARGRHARRVRFD
jgi:hypothetical protein